MKSVYCVYFREKFFWFPCRVWVLSLYHQILEFLSSVSTVEDLFNFPFFCFIDNNRWRWSRNRNLAWKEIVGYEV
jgi:hypothetical protein